MSHENDEMREEMEFHQRARAADLERQLGLTPEEALRRARLEFGSVAAYTEEGREARGWRPLDELRFDLRDAWRSLRKSPAFTGAALVILALAIGTNAAFFTLYGNYALRPLPIRAPERHYAIEGRNAQAGSTFGWSPAELTALRAAASSEVEGVYSASGLLQVLMLSPVERQGMVVAVTADYFPLLGARVAAGRVFGADEERQPVAVLSDAGWKRLFPGEPAPVGKLVRVRATQFTVVGVLSPAFTGTEPAVPDLWVGAGMRGALRDQAGDRQPAYAVLRPGTAAERAVEAFTASASRFERTAVDEKVARVNLERRATYFGEEGMEMNVISALLFGLFLSVVVIACANLANLFLARSAARAQEIGLRSALGATRARLVRQLLTESTLLALAGATGGLLLGAVGVGRAHDWLFALAANAGATVLPVELDWRVFLYTATLGLAAGIAFGLLPALDVTNLKPKRTRRLRNLLLVSQVAASFVLLLMASVLVRNIYRLEAMQPGYDVGRVFDLQSDAPPAALLARLRAQPGVAAVSAVERVPLYGPLRNARELSFNYVDEHYFAAMGIPFVAGTRAKGAAVVSESLARKRWPGASAIGQVLTIDQAELKGAWTVSGVVPDVVNGWLFAGPEAQVVYLPGEGRALENALIRFQDTGFASLAAARRVCATVPGSTGCDPKSLRDVAAMQRFPFQAAAAVASLLGGLALLLTAIGLYSVVSYLVERRRREIGIVLALGAPRSRVAGLVLGEAARCLLAGLGIGLPVCLALSKLGSATVFQIRTFDPLAYLAVPLLLIAVAGLACAPPLARARRVEPMTVLRQD